MLAPEGWTVQLRSGALVVVSLLATPSGFAQDALPPKSLVPERVLATLRIESPGELHRVASPEPNAAEPEPSWLLASVAGFVGLPALEGVALDRPWFAFAVTEEGVPGPWIVLPIADRTAFESSVVGIPEGMGVMVEGEHALLGARPFQTGGGELPIRRGESPFELQAQTGSIYALFADEIETTAVLAALDLERKQTEALNQEYKPPFVWTEIRERVLSQHQTLVGILEQSELTTFAVDPTSEKIRFQLDIAFGSETPMGKLIALQRPSPPSGLEALSERAFYSLWMDFRLSNSAETIEPYMETVAGVVGLSGERFKQLALADAETLMGVSAGHGRVVTETVYRPKSRSVEQHRRLVRDLHAQSPPPGLSDVHRIYEDEIARAHELPVDRLVEYVGVDPSQADAPTSESYFAWGDDRFYVSVVVGEGTGDAFSYLTSLVSRSPGGVPDELRAGLAEAPSDLVFLSWFDLEAWDRAQVGGVIPPMTLEVEGPAVLIHGTTDGAIVRFGGTVDVAQFEAMETRQREVEEAAIEFFDEGQALLYGSDVSKDPAAARGWYEKASVLGHAEATYAIGYLYADGLGVEQSYDNALPWYEKAAAAGSSNALVAAGHLFYYGRGREVDYGRAFTLYQTAAIMGNPSARASLGYMYETGRGVEENSPLAAEWYLMAAEQGDVGAQRSAGRLYFYGRGVEKDLGESERWYRVAAEQGNAESMRMLGGFFRLYRDPEKRDLTQSAEWYRRASEAGDLDATFELAQIYHFGWGVDNDYARAIELYQRLADDGPEQHRGVVLFRLAQAYRFGRHVEQDLGEAARLALASAEQDYLPAKAEIARLYFYGIGVETNETEAVKWLLQSAEEDSAAARLLGAAYETGRGVEQSNVEAIVWYRKSADMGYAPAQWTLGERHERGVGVDQDWSEAAAWYQRAANQGFAAGQYCLGCLYLMGQGLEQDFVESYVWLSLGPWQKLFPILGWTQRVVPLRQGRGFFDVE